MERKPYRYLFGSEYLLQWTLTRLKSCWIPLLSAFLTGCLCHFFAFTNKLVNFDEVGSLFNKGTTATSGRWGLDLLSLLFPDISMPWIYGMISIVIFSISAAMIISIFQVRSPVLQALLAGSILAFPSLTATVTFLYTLSSYAVSFFLAVLSVWLLQKSKKNGVAAAICLIFSVSIYQSYISIAASLLVLILIQQLLLGWDVSQVFRRGVQYVLFLVISLGSYYLLTIVIFQLQETQFNNYVSQRLSFSISYLPTGIYEAYRHFYHFFTQSANSLIATPLSAWIHKGCILIVGIFLLLWFLSQESKGKEWFRFLLLSVLILLLPLAINCMYLFVSADPYYSAIHTLVLYGFISVYIFAVIVAEVCDAPAFFQGTFLNLCSHTLQTFLGIGLAALIVINSYVANATYLNLYLRYENAYGFYTSLLADIRQMPEFQEDTKIAIVGNYQEPNFYWDEFSFTYGIYGANGFNPDTYTNWAFLYYYLGQRLDLVSKEDFAAIQNSETYQKMPVYPYYGSIQFFQDTIVVKLSD